MSETTDHDTLTRLEVQVQHLVQQQAEFGKQGARIEVKVDNLGGQLGNVEGRTTSLEKRLGSEESIMLIEQHREMYGFFSTFKSFIWPLVLSGPVSAVISSLLTFVLIHATQK